ncbi:phosphate acetyltransferase [Mobiluncus mulieris 28-1]|uniref:Phosphate acetyltransferase n=1 Tax=Mobiluncus mulieris TaxID=2052 RepID=A0A2J9KPL0_9ACTO|nr:phosphate acetyltransferase [Mobiluncus mulieris]EEJ53530.1 phosphate acetyltransferase [Mobiluncus mulieris ATCC 35243]EEZ91442.1 phosphate acetyltransferase [Mobiluncus mulieris 28-1]EFN93979.1 phosphate acetyltransferase [Mobiluncus mulieris FB024-16]MBB5845492.1 phosphate acetyltransferase [Mobiluncus mulieris]MCU9976088.1 phosphate acetyltransferase [Mobiluncus mulieris]
MSGFKDSFVANLAKRAAANRKRIVLPEATDERVLRAAAQVLQDGSAEVIFIGEKAEIDTKARVLGVDLSAATVVSLDDTTRLNRYVPKLVELRQHKGMTEEKARETLKDISFFATMMIVCGDADGMVSGAAHTTAHTIRPALQVIKTRPGVKLVSGAFLMVFDDHFDVYSDCAVTIAPTAEQLADIAVVSAATATQFGLEPKVAMLSYSTIDSGTGPMVDLVREATALAKAAAPEMAIDGPLQFDAAVVESVAAKKAPGSKVAGQANTFIFPDLNAGNITYKAVQRTSGALAIGPVLQGLNAPVNDLSRGATVDDIINTVVITAIQAQG